MNRKMTSEHSSRVRGKLKIGDDWNAITIIALSQISPLKAIAELVEARQKTGSTGFPRE